MEKQSANDPISQQTFCSSNSPENDQSVAVAVKNAISRKVTSDNIEKSELNENRSFCQKRFLF